MGAGNAMSPRKAASLPARAPLSSGGATAISIDCCAGTHAAIETPKRTERRMKYERSLERFQPTRRRTERDSEKARDFFEPKRRSILVAGYWAATTARERDPKTRPIPVPEEPN